VALIQDDKIADTILGFLEAQRPVYETIIDRFFDGRRLNLFLGRRASIPTSSLPSIEVQVTSVSLGWHSVRVQQEDATLELDITTDNGHPEQAIRLEAQLVTLTTRTLATPPHLRPRIQNSRTHIYDSLPTNVSYGKADQGRMRVATVTWLGKEIEYLANRLFTPGLQIGKPLAFPPH